MINVYDKSNISKESCAFYLTTSLENLFAFTFSIVTRYRHISPRRRRCLSSGNEIEGNGRE